MFWQHCYTIAGICLNCMPACQGVHQPRKDLLHQVTVKISAVFVLCWVDVDHAWIHSPLAWWHCPLSAIYSSFVVWASSSVNCFGRTISRGKCWAAIWLGHYPKASGRAVHGEVDGLDMGGQHGRRFVLLRHTLRPQSRPYHTQERKRQTTVRRRLSRTHVVLERVIPSIGVGAGKFLMGAKHFCRKTSKKNVRNYSNFAKVSTNFAQISTHFARILRDFARIFTK